ncbi:albusnodin family lasso peptide [Streptomyces pactum]|uniref:Albusnodin family lasso peptide n=1 Tax=Streptomyces pactum TaxID=68249 RepID=A0ABS0NIC5_9ACTN|nr:albusnodin family lasso peptide [Streptomyces pactum]MBH5334958.1 albusnodin family lasso peptide [Streptomyces pactum]
MSQRHTAEETARDADPLAGPSVIVLGDAATLTRGSDQDSTESKQTPYD